MRTGDIAARLGGDEFAVILRNCTLAVGEATAVALVEAISRLGFERNGVAGAIGASIGLTEISSGEIAIDEIISRADAACYEAKASGRGRVTIFEAPAAAASAAALARAS